MENIMKLSAQQTVANNTTITNNIRISILLQALVDSDSKIIHVDIWAIGRQSDAGNFRSSVLFYLLEIGEFNVPSERIISNRIKSSICYSS
jgi:hypothetical protein